MKKLLLCLAALPIVSSSIYALGSEGQIGEGDNSIRFEEKI